MIVERIIQGSMYGLSTGTKKSGHCKEVAIRLSRGLPLVSCENKAQAC